MPKYAVEVVQSFTRRTIVPIEIHERRGRETEDEIGDIIAGMKPEEFEWPGLRAGEVKVINFIEVKDA